MARRGRITDVAPAGEDRRDALHPQPPPALRIRLFGTLDVDGVPRERLGSRKQRSLLRLLASNNDLPVSVDSIADCLWPAGPEAMPVNQISVLASRLRALLGAERITRTDAGYALHADWTDVGALAELTEEAERTLDAAHPARSATAAAAAIALVRGMYLADEPDAAWAAEARDRVAVLVARVRAAAAQAALDAGDPISAGRSAEAGLRDAPFDEHALRLLMTAYARSGRPALALAAFATTRVLLVDELGSDPSPRTEALHASILRGEIAVDPVPGGPVRAVVDGTLPGRDQPWASLSDEYVRCRAGVRVAVVVGEAGIGKTRLVGDWTGAVRADGARVLWASCDSIGSPLTLQAPLDALYSAVATLADDERNTLLENDIDVLAPVLGLPDRRTGAQRPAQDEGGEGQVQLFGSILRVISRVPSLGPVVLVLEDVHLADQATLAWLGFVSRRSAGTPLLVVATTRPEGARSIRATTRIDLAPLDLAAVEAVVGTERAPELFARSGGHPLFLTELARAQTGELPGSIVEAVSERARASGAAISTLRTAAILGPEVDLDLIAGVQRQPAVALLADLEHGQLHGLLEESGASFVFRHELVREALVADASPARRALVHREAARILAGRDDVEPTVLVFHARQGGDLALAADALIRAAAVASARFDHAQAEQLLDDAIDIAAGPALHLARGRVRLTRDDFSGAGDDAATARGLGAGPAALELGGWAAYYRRDFVLAGALAAEAEAELGADDPLLASVLTLAGRIDHADGNLASAGDRLQRAVASSGPSAGVAGLWLSWWLVDSGDLDPAATLLARADHDPSLASHPFATAHRALLSASVAGLQGRVAAALSLLDRVDQEVERRALVHFTGRSLNYRAWLLRNLLDASPALELNQAATEVSREQGLREPQAQAALDLADAALRRDDLGDASQELARAAALAATGHAYAWRVVLRHRLLTTRVALADGRAHEAAHLARELATDAGAMGVRRYVILAELLAAQAGAIEGAALGAADHDRVAVSLDALDEVAGPEAWWVTASLAAAFDESSWWAAAGARMARLAAGSGVRGEAFARRAGAELDRMRAAGPRGQHR